MDEIHISSRLCLSFCECFDQWPGEGQFHTACTVNDNIDWIDSLATTCQFARER